MPSGENGRDAPFPVIDRRAQRRYVSKARHTQRQIRARVGRYRRFLDRVGSDFTARYAAPKSPTAVLSRGMHGLGRIRTVKVISHALTTIIGILVAGAVSGATGVALPLIAGPIFLMTFAPVEAVALTALCSITGQLFSMALLRRAIVFEFRARLMLAGLLGVPLGSALLTRLSPSMVHLSLGALIVLGGVWGLFQPTSREPRPAGRADELLVGLTGGLTAGWSAPPPWCPRSGAHGMA
jgi:Sulfite exporter TauE/SafE